MAQCGRTSNGPLRLILDDYHAIHPPRINDYSICRSSRGNAQPLDANVLPDQQPDSLAVAGCNCRTDNPTTTETALACSDPILSVGEPGSWDAGGVASYEIMYNDGLWEMFFVGFPS